MARKSKAVNGAGIDMPAGVRDDLMRTMDQIAHRMPTLEWLILRLARVGQLVDVEKAILKRRDYAQRRDKAEAREMP